MAAAAGVAVAQPPAERIDVNDNRRPAGTLESNTLTIQLEARRGEWVPDGEGGGAVTVNAFAEGGGPLQAPVQCEVRVIGPPQRSIGFGRRLTTDFMVNAF